MKNYEIATKMVGGAPLRNWEGGVTYALSLKETVAEFFSLGLLNGTFYQSEEEVLRNARHIFERALVECPEFATKAAIYGNNVNSLKLVPMIWTVYLSTLEDKTLFKKAFPRIIRNPKMLHDFMEISRKSDIRKGLGRAVKKAINDWMFEKLNEYQVSRNKGKLSEIIKVTRPCFSDVNFQNYMKYLAKDELTFARAIALKEVLDSLKKGEYNIEVEQKIVNHKLQLEELKHSISALSHADKQKLYSVMYEGLNYAALILNLVALERVFATKTRQTQKYTSTGYIDYVAVIETKIPDQIIDMVVERIKDVNLYRKSNMLPFALLNAERMVVTPEFKKAIADMFKLVANESFHIDENIELLVATDTSGSMESTYVNEHLNCADIASFFASMIKKSHNNTEVYAVASYIKQVDVRAQEDVFTMANKIRKTNVEHGTEFEQIMNHYKGQKYVILITDSVQADDLESVWIKTKKPKDAKLIVWQTSSNGVKISNDSSVVYVRGYSDRLLELIKLIIESNGNQLDEIEKIVL